MYYTLVGFREAKPPQLSLFSTLVGGFAADESGNESSRRDCVPPNLPARAGRASRIKKKPSRMGRLQGATELTDRLSRHTALQRLAALPVEEGKLEEVEVGARSYHDFTICYVCIHSSTQLARGP